jgi:hypothetical protein
MPDIKTETLMAEDSLDAKRWTTLVEHSSVSDVYYLPEYARATAAIESTEPLALVAGTPCCRMLAPLLLRRRSATLNGFPAQWLDASTPYGYGGLLGLSTSPCVHPEHFRVFVDELSAWCCDRNVVCCVIRLHPLIGQQDWFEQTIHWQDRIQLHSSRTTSSIDLSQWDQTLDQPATLRRDRRADMRLAGRNLRITWNTGDDDDADIRLSIFSTLYDGLLHRNAAESFYSFPQSHFTKLKTLGTRLGLALAWHGDEPVGGNLFLAGPRYAHGHLAGTNDMGRKYGASTFLIVEGARWARLRGCELLHLGGGTRPGDSLEDFKRTFGGSSHVYRFVTLIADRKRFDEICNLPNPSWPYNLRNSTVQPDCKPTT